MTDPTDTSDEAAKAETPAQKALRLKQERIAAAPKNPRGGRYQAEMAAAARSQSKSKPWMKK